VPPMYDLLIENGQVFDGTGAPSRSAHVGVKDGKVEVVSASPLPRSPTTRVIDAAGCWVTPGFIDLHTHYDAEVELSPSLAESVRHGVTTVLLGSCSLSLAVGTPEDLADMYCRVEAIPDHVVRPLLERKKDWHTLSEYFAHLEGLPLGPNVASFCGHSALRAHVMGIARSLEPSVRPTPEELGRMRGLLEEALDLGYLGLSIMTLRWDKMGGSRAFRSRPLPSTFARWAEYRALLEPLRRRGRIFQGVPDVTRRTNLVWFLLASAGLVRRPLKTTVIAMFDLRSSRSVYRLAGLASRVFNRFLGAQFRWQALPEVFDLWADGIDLVVFEEFGAGAAALHLQDLAERAALLRDPAYRARFRREWTSRLLPKAFHRDFNQSEILACPDPSLVGKSFAQAARERGVGAVELFLDLAATHGSALRWYTVMANDRREPLQRIVSHPDVLIGFSDAGAHLRNMAHYNFPLRLLRLVREADRRGAPFMSVERAVWRLTGEIAGWLDIDAGHLAPGKRADLVVVDPSGLDESLDAVQEAPMEGFHGYQRLVRRNDRAVRAVLVIGRLAVADGRPAPVLGRQAGFGRLLRAQR
jgi:N-acyl-D-aspartate/D-glutamate deacylase